MSRYLRTEASVPVAVAMRLVDLDGIAYDRDNVSSITYAVALLGALDESEETEITATTSLTVNDIMPASVTNPASWTEDPTGYNFRHFFSTSPFTTVDRVYKVTYTLVVSSVTVSVDIYVTTSPSRVADGYCLQRHIENIFGAPNVRVWADLSNLGLDSDIGGRIAESIAEAKNEIDDRLRGGPYKIPFTTIPDTIRTLSARYAGVWLYESRGVEDFDEDTGVAIHRLSWHRKQVDQVIAQIMRGQRRLDAELISGHAGYQAPSIVLDEE